ncbi:MAG: class I SAM-dependent methyltransferase [Methanosarcina barkeri]|nr:class I SAM-dependent methyltransferase [Methanosarcina sp. ERenArc_MAG2]
MLGADHVYASDVYSYENPDFIIDLNNPIREEYRERFDIIIDVGTLEHVYDVPTALENIIKMLKIDGIVILILPSSGAIDHGFYSFSPTLFFDYFECNGFETLNCYLMRCNSRNYTQKKPVYRYCGFGREYPLKTDDCVEVFYSAKKENM